MSFLNYVHIAQVEFESKLGFKPKKIIIPCWRMDEILNEFEVISTKKIKEFLYIKKRRINRLNILWTNKVNFITLV